MHELMMILASAMPEEMVIDQLQAALTEYKSDPTKEKRANVATVCVLFASKETIDTTRGGLDTILDKMEKTKKGFDLMNIKSES